MAKLELTSAFCRDVPCPAGKRKAVYRCTKCPGLGIEVRASGKKTYWLHLIRPSGNRVQIKIGDHPDMPLETAQQSAEDLRASIISDGTTVSPT